MMQSLLTLTTQLEHELMATIQKRQNKNKTFSYRVMIRQSDGYPASYKTFPTKQEAKDWAKQEETQRRQGAYFPEQTRAKHTLNELIDQYIKIILPTKPKNAADTKRHLNWWSSKIGKFAVQNITSEVIANLKIELSEGLTPKGNKRSNGTVNRYLAALSAVLTYAVKECGWILTNPCHRVSKLKESTGRDRIASEAECLQLLEECKKSRNEHLYLITLLAMTTGMRQGEITGITWDCVDLKNKTIFLKNTKNGKPRTIPIVGNASKLLAEKYLTHPQHTPYVFPAKKRFGHICIRKAWDEVRKRVGIEDFRFHDLRHTFATYAAEDGASTLELGSAMGHRTPQMTVRYTHMNANSTRRFSDAVENRLLNHAAGLENEFNPASVA